MRPTEEMILESQFDAIERKAYEIAAEEEDFGQFSFIWEWEYEGEDDDYYAGHMWIKARKTDESFDHAFGTQKAWAVDEELEVTGFKITRIEKLEE